ncbi:MAG: RNA methyltransferase [Balneolaceae bacterium]
MKFGLPSYQNLKPNQDYLQEASINQIKLLRKLSLRKNREKKKLFLIEGERAVDQVLEHGFLKIESIFVDESKANSYKKLANSFLLEEKTFLEITDTETPQGVLAVCIMPNPVSLRELEDIESGIIVATDAIQDPGNLGTIIRTASWFGATAILLGKGTVDIFNPKVVRSTVGSTGTLPFLVGELNQFITQLEQSGWNTLLLDGNAGSIPINQIQKNKKTILVVGNEANGISGELMSENRQRTLIPSKSSTKNAESLNAAVALSIGLWSVNN